MTESTTLPHGYSWCSFNKFKCNKCSRTFDDLNLIHVLGECKWYSFEPCMWAFIKPTKTSRNDEIKVGSIYYCKKCDFESNILGKSHCHACPKCTKRIIEQKLVKLPDPKPKSDFQNTVKLDK